MLRNFALRYAIPPSCHINSPNPAYYEEDYRPVAPERVSSHFLPGSSVEIVHMHEGTGDPRGTRCSNLMAR